ncbi:MAG: hypothetical protein WAM07_17250 [Halobacillus sp.]|uniref:hypothetical protein n=1 Tax=Halobacillus sp. TaxID=56800 RepID=UPI003BAE271C
MYDPKNPVENQETEKAPEHGDELEQVHEDDQQPVNDHGRGPYQPVYGESYEEEYAQETAVAPIDEPFQTEEKETTMESDVKVGMGWLGLSAAILSFFFAPLILGAAGIVLGIIGKRRGADTLGNMAIIISIVSIAFSIFFAPIYNLI